MTTAGPESGAEIRHRFSLPALVTPGPPLVELIKRTMRLRCDPRLRSAAHREVSSTPPSQQSGQGMVEYALILVLVSIVVIVILLTMGGQIANVFSNVITALTA